MHARELLYRNITSQFTIKHYEKNIIKYRNDIVSFCHLMFQLLI